MTKRIGRWGLLALLMAVPLSALGWLFFYYTEVGMANVVEEKGRSLSAEEYLAVPQAVIDDATELARGMVGDSQDKIEYMVNQLLDSAKLESGHLPSDQAEVGLQSLLEDVVSRLDPLAREASISVELSIAPGLPPVYVDPPLISRVVSNLLDNAIKFTPDEGHIELWARPAPELPDEYLMVGVTDTGPGIPPEQRARLFRKFQQAISTAGRRLGTGLGLPFCKLVVEAHGGRIWVESEVGKGTTFVMLLPTAESGSVGQHGAQLGGAE